MVTLHIYTQIRNENDACCLSKKKKNVLMCFCLKCYRLNEREIYVIAVGYSNEEILLLIDP